MTATIAGRVGGLRGASEITACVLIAWRFGDEAPETRRMTGEFDTDNDVRSDTRCGLPARVRRRRGQRLSLQEYSNAGPRTYARTDAEDPEWAETANGSDCARGQGIARDQDVPASDGHWQSDAGDSLMGGGDFRRRIEALLIPILHTGDVGIDRIAGMLGVGRQAIVRKLAFEGITYKRALAELRYRMAVRYLRNNGVSVTETAYLLGYSEPAAFSHAFKRWTGLSPREMCCWQADVTALDPSAADAPPNDHATLQDCPASRGSSGRHHPGRSGR